MFDEKRTNYAECSRKVVNGRKAACAIRSLVNAKGLSLDCTRVLHEDMWLSVLMYSRETILWNKRDRSKMQSVQKNNLGGVC